MKSNSEIDAVDRLLQQLRVEFERYFNGALDLPPIELQNSVGVKIRDLRNKTRSSVDNFRLNSLEAKYNSYNEMFNRRLRDVEEGRVKIRNRDTSHRVNVEQGVMVSGRIDDSAAAVFYQALYGDSSQGGKIDLDKFRGYLNQQTRRIRQKTGCSQVQFRLQREGGRFKLKAKPLGKAP